MEQVNKDENFIEHYFNNNESAIDLILNNEKKINEFIQAEEAIYNSIHASIENYVDSTNDTNDEDIKLFQEELDIHKAEKLMERDDLKYPLPQYLKNFLEAEEKTKEVKNDSIIVKIGKESLKLLGAFFEKSSLELIPQPAVIVRSKNTVFQSNSLSLQEKTKNEVFTYQLIKENDEEAYLCIRFDNKIGHGYDHVNIKKNERFIYSNNIDQDGIVSIMGLKEGSYCIEFVGKKSSKSIDLSILVE